MRPKNPLKLFKAFGWGQSYIAWTFFRTTLTPSRPTICPKYSTSSMPKEHLIIWQIICDPGIVAIPGQHAENVCPMSCCRWECYQKRLVQFFWDMVSKGGSWGSKKWMGHYKDQMAWPRIHNGLHEFGRLSWECQLPSLYLVIARTEIQLGKKFGTMQFIK